MATTRQVTFRQTGSVAYGDALNVVVALREAGYYAVPGSQPSPAGSWADTVYVMTDAPMATVRKAARAESLDVGR